MREIFVETGGRKTTAGGENSGETRKGAEGARRKRRISQAKGRRYTEG